MSELLYQLDSYLKEFDAKISAVNEELHAVALDRTAFYPGGGGQPHDTGWLEINGGALEVTRTKKVGADVWHFLTAQTSLPPVGASARGKLNWERRYQTMRTHTAMHVLCGVVFRDYGAQVTGGDMDPLNARMDFEFEKFSADLVNTIEEAVNREISAARPVRTQILPREEAFQIPDLIRTKINLLPEGIEEVRTVEIVGLDLQADGGTHVRNTSEVGVLRVVKHKSKGKINKRIYVEISDPE
ncbi:MAG: alanyl-tRNA editing protein [Anaerolineaceae bacterium]|nr:alanyl-tRNA editing protein [Anaerolineaceae bacterium]